MSDPTILIYDVSSIVVSFCTLLLLTVVLLHHYTKKGRMRPEIYLVLGFDFFISFAFLALITTDVATGLHAMKMGEDVTGLNVYLVYIWSILYWTIQLLAWIIIPVCHQYVVNGEFSFIRRMFWSAIDCVLSYLVYGAILGAVVVVVLLWVIFKNAAKGLTIDSFVGLGISASNAYGLVLLTTLLGYGMVELPRHLWHYGDMERKIRLYELRALRLSDSNDDEEDKLHDLLCDVRSMDFSIYEDDPLRKYMDKILKTCAREMDTMKVTSRDSRMEPTYKALVKLHRKVMEQTRKFRQVQYQWRYTVRKALYLQDVILSKTNPEWRIESAFASHSIVPEFVHPVTDRIRWFYMLYLRKWLFRVLALIFIAFFVILLWCELNPTLLKITTWFGYPINFSVFYWLSYGLAFNRFLVQCVSLCFVSIIALSIYFSLFRIKIFSFYQLIPHHSDATSLLFVAMFLSRVIPTLCFNYIQILGIQSEGAKNQDSQIAFVRVYGTLYLKELELIGFLGGLFTDLFPLLIVLIAFVTFFNILGRLGALCRFEHYMFNDHVTNESIAEGHELLQNAREEILKKKLEYPKNQDDPELGSKTSRWQQARAKLRGLLSKRSDSGSSERQQLRSASYATYGGGSSEHDRISTQTSTNILDLL